MARKAQLKRALERIGASWDERHDCLDSPDFHVWKSNGNHSIALVYDGMEDGERRSDIYEHYLEEVRFGVEPCNIPDCDMCAERLEELHNQQKETPTA